MTQNPRIATLKTDLVSQSSERTETVSKMMEGFRERETERRRYLACMRRREYKLERGEFGRKREKR